MDSESSSLRWTHVFPHMLMLANLHIQTIDGNLIGAGSAKNMEKQMSVLKLNIFVFPCFLVEFLLTKSSPQLCQHGEP